MQLMLFFFGKNNGQRSIFDYILFLKKKILNICNFIVSQNEIHSFLILLIDFICLMYFNGFLAALPFCIGNTRSRGKSWNLVIFVKEGRGKKFAFLERGR